MNEASKDSRMKVLIDALNEKFLLNCARQRKVLPQKGNERTGSEETNARPACGTDVRVESNPNQQGIAALDEEDDEEPRSVGPIPAVRATGNHVGRD